ncbi:MAG: twin-arginine translocase TatA/TatE family subunit [Bacillota bacterium]|nr:twin-arginine translocase TatA/TatE family subunit [Bacillota bacterium]
MRIGYWEILVLLLVVVLLFGPRRLPEIGRAFGRTIQEFRHATKEGKGDGGDKDEPSSSPESHKSKGKGTGE